MTERSLRASRRLFAVAFALLLLLGGPFWHRQHLLEEEHHAGAYPQPAFLGGGPDSLGTSGPDGHDPHHVAEHESPQIRAARGHTAVELHALPLLAVVAALEPQAASQDRVRERPTPARRGRDGPRPQAPRGPPVS